MYFFLQNSVGFSVWICNVEVLILSNSYLILLGEIWLISSCRVGRVCSRVLLASSMLSEGHFFSKISLIRGKWFLLEVVEDLMLSVFST